MLAAVAAGRDWISPNTSVMLGAVLTKDGVYNGRQREVRVNGMLIATMGNRMFIRVPVTDRLILDRLNALLKQFVGEAYSVGLTKARNGGILFATHPKENSLTGNIQVGHTFLDVAEWWEVPGKLHLDCTIVEGSERSIGQPTNGS